MPRYTAAQIYAFARTAGFSPDQSATMPAIALAESGGNSRAHNPRGEDSQGLWQINADAHPELARRFDLYDPAQNAHAAFVVSHGGTDVSPWTTTHHGGSARYLRFQEEAQAAAAAYGDGDGRGVWSGTSGYGDVLSAGPDDGTSASERRSSTGSDPAVGTQTTESSTANSVPGRAGHDFGIPLDNPDDARRGAEYGIPLDEPDAPAGGQSAVPATGDTTANHDPATPATPATAQAGGDSLQRFLESALAQTGDRYVYGAEVRLGDPNPTAFDCSELVEWAAHQAGVRVPDGAWAQYQHLHQAGTLIPVDEAIRTPGALLFSFSSDPNGPSRPSHAHVAISLGNGTTIEAYGTEYGVGSFDATTRRFTYAAVIPGISASPDRPPDTPTQVTAPEPPVDDFDSRLELDPDSLDTDPRVLANSLELTDTPVAPHQPGAPEPGVPDLPEPPGGVTPADANADGFEDSLWQAIHWAPDLPDAPDGGQHDTVDHAPNA